MSVGATVTDMETMHESKSISSLSPELIAAGTAERLYQQQRRTLSPQYSAIPWDQRLGGKALSPWIWQHFVLTAIGTNSVYEFALPACSTLARSTIWGHRMSDLRTWSPTKHFLPIFWKRNYGNGHLTVGSTDPTTYPTIQKLLSWYIITIFWRYR